MGLNLATGSWDATAKIWDLEAGECTQTLANHKYAVTVCFIDETNLVTGSQDGGLNLWTVSGQLVKNLPEAHKNIIRGIVKLDELGILTCSNDSDVKMWSADLTKLAEFTEIHSSFVFALAQLDGSNFVSGGEDFKLCIQKDGKNQSLPHPSTIWGVQTDRANNWDIFSVCGDG